MSSIPTHIAALLVASVALNVLGVGLFLYRRATREPVQGPAPYQKARRTHFDTLAVDEGALVMVGDSLTDWAEWGELKVAPHVVNRGISSDTVADVRARIDGVLASEPGTIALMIGFNDLDQGRAVDDVARDHRALVSHIRSGRPSTRLLVQSVLPVGRSYRGAATPSAIASLNERIATHAAELDAEYVDVRAAVADDSGALAADLTVDGIHLNGAGYQRWRDALVAAL